MEPVDRSRPTTIGQHGVIGDLETLALVGRDSSVEWWCWPRFDSPSVFGRLLDDDGGHWRIEPADGYRTHQLYLPDTNVLVTRFHVEHGLVEIEDCMAIGSGRRMLVRRVTGIRGTVAMQFDCSPRPDYGRTDVRIDSRPDGHGDAVTISWSDDALLLSSSVALDAWEGRIAAEFEVSEGESVLFALGDDTDEPHDDDLDRDVRAAVDATAAFWRSWISHSNYQGRWREIVERSALTLKLLTHRPSGGLIAAGTTSLPETLGGSRNWDYRYVWIRDAAFAMYAFMELGFVDEAAAFTSWLQDRVRGCAKDGSPPLTPLYDLDGNAALDEIELDHWSGYLDSAPVRIGNAASEQLQLDIYGEIIDSLYLADKRGGGLSLDAWDDVRHLVDWVCNHWDQPDEGFWEVRNGPYEFTSSRLMCWVALERAIRMARFRGRPADIERWSSVRDDIHAVVVERGWSEQIGAFTQTLDGDTLDASLLLMPLVKFIASSDPKWHSTLDAIGHTLVHDALVDRYEAGTDGLVGDEGSFSICSFWYVEALARAGRAGEARLLFDKILTYAGPLGVYSETISDSGIQLGNFPQAFTHLSLISAAVAIEEALER